jgi:hypothetical protein
MLNETNLVQVLAMQIKTGVGLEKFGQQSGQWRFFTKIALSNPRTVFWLDF